MSDCEKCRKVKSELRSMARSMGYESSILQPAGCHHAPMTMAQFIEKQMREDHVATLISAVVISGDMGLIEVSEMAARQIFGTDAVTVHCRHQQAKKGK